MIQKTAGLGSKCVSARTRFGRRLSSLPHGHAPTISKSTWKQSPTPPNIDILVTDDEGRTTTDGVYAAGRITGERHQAIVNAGSGANAGLTLVEDANPDFYNDWVVPEGYYESYEMDVPVGVEEIGHEERRRRIEQSQKTRAYFTDDQ